MLQIRGYLLLELIFVQFAGLLMCLGSSMFLLHTIKIYCFIKQQQTNQHSRIIVKHYMCHDIIAARHNIVACFKNDSLCQAYLTKTIVNLINKNHIKDASSFLILPQEQTSIIYYLRKSVIPSEDMRAHYALYRDDLLHNAQALVENIEQFVATIADNTLHIQLQLANAQTVEIICTSLNIRPVC